MSEQAQSVVMQEPAAYAMICGILALILAIVGVLIPVVGVLFITPLAIVFGAIALYGGSKTMGITVLVINVVNLMISPTFWLNIAAGAKIADAGNNRLLIWFDAIGVIVMFALVARKKR
ncbi:MAG TPA: hypothetical protein VI636_11620 [Candidatus Angelobacter sp.]